MDDDRKDHFGEEFDKKDGDPLVGCVVAMLIIGVVLLLVCFIFIVPKVLEKMF